MKERARGNNKRRKKGWWKNVQWNNEDEQLERETENTKDKKKRNKTRESTDLSLEELVVFHVAIIQDFDSKQLHNHRAVSSYQSAGKSIKHTAVRFCFMSVTPKHKNYVKNINQV